MGCVFRRLHNLPDYIQPMHLAFGMCSKRLSEYINSLVGYCLTWWSDSSDDLSSHRYLQVRMPSGMRGFKEGVFEGGIRNTLVVRGPGVHQGATSYTLSSLMDVTPTIAELAGVTPPVADKGQLPWTGISLAGVIKGGEPSVKHQERMLFSMSAECVGDDFVPLLGPAG